MNHSFSIIPLTVEARGEIITNNLPEFRELVREALGNINRDLKTDEEFGQAELDVKALKGAEDTVRAAALQAFDEKLKELVDGLNETAEEIRAPRLELEKLITKRKEEVKGELITEAMDKLDCAPRLRLSTYGKSITDAIKGKRTLDSMQKALAMIVVGHNGAIAKNRESISSFIKTHGEDLVPDREDLEVKSPDSVEGELRRRFEAKRANDERKRLEEYAKQARAEAEALKAAAPLRKGRLPDDDLPQPPKIGSIPVGGNVIPFNAENPSQATIGEAEEWQEVKQTVIAAFGLIKEHRERLTHDINRDRLMGFGAAVNAAWKECQAVKEAMS